jgi:hypothetical protein
MPTTATVHKPLKPTCNNLNKVTDHLQLLLLNRATNINKLDTLRRRHTKLDRRDMVVQHLDIVSLSRVTRLQSLLRDGELKLKPDHSKLRGIDLHNSIMVLLPVLNSLTSTVQLDLNNLIHLLIQVDKPLIGIMRDIHLLL